MTFLTILGECVKQPTDFYAPHLGCHMEVCPHPKSLDTRNSAEAKPSAVGHGRQTLMCQVPWERSQGFKIKQQRNPLAAWTRKYFFRTDTFILCESARSWAGSLFVGMILSPWCINFVYGDAYCMSWQIKRSGFRAEEPTSSSPRRQRPLLSAHERCGEVAPLLAHCGLSPACKLSVT